MKITVLGAGNVGEALGRALARAGHEICFGVRKPDSIEMKAIVAAAGANARAGTVVEAVQFGEVIIAALPWPAAKGILQGLDLREKILLDCTNPLLPELAGIEVGTTSSGGEQIAAVAPGARVVKIFNTTGSNNMANPVYQGKATPMFYCGDDAGAKQVAARLAQDVGFEPVDAGPLTNSRLLEPLAMLWIWLAYPGGNGREFAFTIAKR